MLNLKISVISPAGGFQNLFHDDVYDILLIHNGFEGQESHFSATCKYSARKEMKIFYVVLYVAYVVDYAVHYVVYVVHCSV